MRSSRAGAPPPLGAVWLLGLRLAALAACLFGLGSTGVLAQSPAVAMDSSQCRVSVQFDTSLGQGNSTSVPIFVGTILIQSNDENVSRSCTWVCTVHLPGGLLCCAHWLPSCAYGCSAAHLACMAGCRAQVTVEDWRMVCAAEKGEGGCLPHACLGWVGWGGLSWN